jgi:hypothetical protein
MPTPSARSAAGDELGLDQEIYCPPTDPAWQEAWQLTESLLGEIQERVTERGARLVVATLSNAAQVDPDPGRRRERFRRIGACDPFYPEQRLGAFCARRSIAYLALAPRLAAHAEATGEYLHGFANTEPGTGHWNRTGHRVAGELLAAFVCAELAGP